jgi:hypothetical protein
MNDKKKREEATAEITAYHLTQWVATEGHRFTQEDAVAFLIQDGHAYDMWMHMMEAGEAYLQARLDRQHQLVN